MWPQFTYKASDQDIHGCVSHTVLHLGIIPFHYRLTLFFHLCSRNVLEIEVIISDWNKNNHEFHNAIGKFYKNQDCQIKYRMPDKRFFAISMSSKMLHVVYSTSVKNYLVFIWN